MTKRHDVPTLDAVRAQGEQLEDLRYQVADLADEEQTLAHQIAEALATRKDATALRTRRTECRALRADLAEAITLTEHRLAEDREAAGRAEAERRLVGIARAYGAQRAELDDDEARYRDAVTACQVAAARINDRFQALVALRAEADALSDRFDLAMPTLAAVAPPAARRLPMPAVRFVESGFVRAVLEADEHQLRSRRTYGEVADTEGSRIIAVTGLRAWPPLTDVQQGIVEERERVRATEAVQVARFAAGADPALHRRGW